MNWICSECSASFSRPRARCPTDGHRVIEDLRGQRIGGRYDVRDLIGVGGMDSSVWKAWQSGTERVVAVKVLPPATEAAAKRFARGAKIAANLGHPNNATIHDYGRTEDGKLFLVMEFLDGQLLQDALGYEGMPVEDTLHITDQLLQCLEHAHRDGAVHRDLKPDNIFLISRNDDARFVKILDFGIAKYAEEGSEERESDALDSDVTEQRQVCGTPQYMAPEQVVGAPVDARTDLYSLGVVMYRMLAGQLPFDGKTRYELYQKHLQSAPPRFKEVRPDLDIPERLELIVMKALSKRAERRFQNAREMREALYTVWDQLGGAAMPSKRRPTTSRVAAVRMPPAVHVTSPAMPAPAPPVPAHSQVERREGTLSAVQIRHPSRLGMYAPSPSETEPNSATRTGSVVVAPVAKPRSNGKTVAILAAAFVLGLGGVVGVMKLIKSDAKKAPPVASVTGTTAPSAAAGVGTDPKVGVIGSKETAEPDEVVADRQDPLAVAAKTKTAQPPKPAAPAADVPTDAAGVKQAALEVPVAAKTFPIRFDAFPSNTSVSINGVERGAVPLSLELGAGSYSVRYARPGYISQVSTLVVTESTATAVMNQRATLSLEPLPVEPVRVHQASPTTTTRRATTKRRSKRKARTKRGSAKPWDDAYVPKQPKRYFPAKKDTKKKPNVDLLDDSAPAPKRKTKPKVDLLDD